VLLTGVHFLQCSEYWVMCINVRVIYVTVISFTDFVKFVYTKLVKKIVSNFLFLIFAYFAYN
jgi:hypothetical protein